MIMIICAAGLTWLLVCYLFWMRDVRRELSEKGVKGLPILWKSRWLKDIIVSVIFILLGISLMGVTGMVIGMMSSVMASIVIWTWGLLNRRKA